MDTKPTSITDVDVVHAYEEAEKLEVREYARGFCNEAIKTLVKLMRGSKTPPSVKRQCATDILSQGYGRPDSRSDSGGVTAEKAGLTVNILKLSTNTVERIEGPSDAIDVIEAMDVAKAIVESQEGEGA
jgi:hypothetical protein